MKIFQLLMLVVSFTFVTTADAQINQNRQIGFGDYFLSVETEITKSYGGNNQVKVSFQNAAGRFLSPITLSSQRTEVNNMVISAGQQRITVKRASLILATPSQQGELNLTVSFTNLAGRGPSKTFNGTVARWKH